MRTVYVADDGKSFENWMDCEKYEWMLNHPKLNSIEFYDKDGNRLRDPTSEDTYNHAEIVIVPTQEALVDLQDLSVEYGYCAYETIYSIGKWKFDGDPYNPCFKKISRTGEIL